MQLLLEVLVALAGALRLRLPEAAARVRQLLWIVRQVVRSACGISKTFVLKVTHYLRPA